MTYISVVVPVYNAGIKLHKCIKSILNQTHRDFELILVNDGSTDTSLDICKIYEEKDSRVRVINKKNEGSILTRKTGIDAALYDYIMFVDADDWVSQNIIERMIKELIESNADICVCNMYSVLAGVKKKVENTYLNSSKLYKGEEIFTHLIRAYLWGHPFPSSLCAKLYKKELLYTNGKYLEKIKFLGDDLFYNLEILLQTKSVKVIDSPLYYYRRGGFTSKYMPYLFHDTINCYQIQKDVIENYFQSSKHQEMNGISVMLLNTFKTCLYNLFNGKLTEKDIRTTIMYYLNSIELLESINNENSIRYFDPDYLKAIENKDIDYLYKIGKQIYRKRIPRNMVLKAASILA
ncbi:glycosyltransferase family 2 protein [Robertmurraya sp. FSL R5-0851]|uniref:glycosyltransferase family 2 protein n=1 Tax=Robertmurraya sp. FSL R5-0851 TaxID=2921584 RepID=UPI0030F70884